MARPIWKGSVSFGLVTIPVTLFSAENREEELHFNLLDSRNHAKIKYKKVNEATGEEVPWDQIIKGYEYEDGQYVFLGDEDFKRAAVDATQTVSIEDFVDRDAIKYVFFDKPYYLVPGKGGEKAYALLRETLKRTGKVGIARVVMRTRQYLAAVIPEGDALVMDVVRYANEIRTPEEVGIPEAVAKAGKIKPQELAMAEQLVETMSGDWEPEKYRDEYKDKLMKWIEQKVERGEFGPAAGGAATEEEGEAPAPINIMDLLKRSVEGRGKGKPSRKAATDEPPNGKAAGRKAQGGTKKKAPARSTGAKKKTTRRRAA
ncbi:MAG TPA: Ku protein [Phycisphaerales bacterium]|nr:Ku protein [Phycisphaerales bacterium]